MTVHELLVEGRNRLGREAWFNGKHGESSGRCAVTAVDPELDAEVEVFRGALWALRRAIGIPDETGEHLAEPIARWNDAPGRTKAEVLAAFDRAIAATAPPPADPLPGELPDTELDDTAHLVRS